MSTRTTVVKVQLPLSTNDPVPKAMVYDETRSFQKQIPVTSALRKKMGSTAKRFFYATVTGNDGDVEIGAVASWRAW